MKVSREALKEIVKECLVEILTEGVGRQLSESSKTSSKVKLPQVAERTIPTSLPKRIQQQLPTRADYTPASSIRAKQPDRTAKVVENITDNPIMREMLESTAATTLREQIMADKPGALSSLSPAVQELVDDYASSGVDISVLQPEANIWSKLAFGEVKKK